MCFGWFFPCSLHFTWKTLPILFPLALAIIFKKFGGGFLVYLFIFSKQNLFFFGTFAHFSPWRTLESPYKFKTVLNNVKFEVRLIRLYLKLDIVALERFVFKVFKLIQNEKLTEGVLERWQLISSQISVFSESIKPTVSDFILIFSFLFVNNSRKTKQNNIKSSSFQSLYD